MLPYPEPLEIYLMKTLPTRLGPGHGPQVGQPLQQAEGLGPHHRDAEGPPHLPHPLASAAVEHNRRETGEPGARNTAEATSYNVQCYDIVYQTIP